MSGDVKMNKMGTANIKKLMLTMGLPMILSMVLQAFYNIVDSYFVSQIPGGMGDNAINALTLAFPIQILMIAIGVGTGVGVNSLLSRQLGQGDKLGASKTAGNAIFIGICTYVVFLAFGIVGVRPYISSQTGDQVIIEMGVEYLAICSILSFGSILSMIYEKMLQATGRTVMSMIAQLAGALTNIVLDPIMIFGYFGCPELGIAGAAYATVIGQIVTLIISLCLHHFCNKDLHTHIKYIRPEGRIIGNIYKVGAPAILMQALTSFMSYGVNMIFGAVSTGCVTAYGVYYKIQQFVFFAAFGMNNAIIPIVAFNYGMGDKKRIKNGIRWGITYILIIMALGTLVLEIFAGPIAGIFKLEDHTLWLCELAIRIISIGYLFAGVNIAAQAVFQALGNGVKSLIVSLVRMIIVPLPAALLLTHMSNAEAVIWYSFPLGEIIGFVVSIFLLAYITKRTINKINDRFE